MSVSAPDNPAPPAEQPHTAKFPDLHSLAVDVVSDLHALAMGLHQIGAPSDAVAVVQNMTQSIARVSETLAHAPTAPNPAHQAQQQGSPQSQQPAPSQPASGGEQAPQQAGGANNPHKALGNAISALHQQAFQNAQQQTQAAGQ